MLSQYHRKFLKVLTSFEVDFLIVGGQAKYFHFGIPTRDLDIWTPIDGNRVQKLECALRRWIEVHPMHNDSIAFANGQLNLRPNLKIDIPTDDVWFEAENGDFLEVKIDDGIDILTSIGSMDFDECFRRSSCFDEQLRNCHLLSTVDLEVAKAIRNEREQNASN